MMRYAKGSFVIKPDRDVPLLRQVRNSKFISHEQLFELLQHGAFAPSRSTFNWRVRRLLTLGHMEMCEGIYVEGVRIYRITQLGLLELEGRDDFMAAVSSKANSRPDKMRIFHALELNAIQIALIRKNLLVHWRSEVEIVSSNMLARQEHQKDYDAIVEVWSDGKIRRFALEYERTLKGNKQYEKIRESLDTDRQTGCILYLTSGPQITAHLAGELATASKLLGFATAESFRNQLLETQVVTNPSEPTVSFERLLKKSPYIY